MQKSKVKVQSYTDQYSLSTINEKLERAGGRLTLINIPGRNFFCFDTSRSTVALFVPEIDNDNLSKPLHRSTNSIKPYKTIDSRSRKIIFF